MAKAVTCPVCNSSGKLITSDIGSTTANPWERTCHGCNGKGWVEVSDDSYPQYPWYPMYPVPSYPNIPYPYPNITWEIT